MLSWDFFRHYLLSRRAGALVRTVAWLSMVGVGLGVFSLIVVMSVMNGFNDSYKRRLLAVEPHLVATVPGVTQATVLNEHPVFVELQSFSGVQTQVFETQDVILRTMEGLFSGAVAKGVEPKALASIFQATQKERKRQKASAGSAIEEPPVLGSSSEMAAGEVFLGIDLARSLGVFEGDSLVVLPPEGLLLPAGEAPPFERVVVKGLITTNIPSVDSRVLFYGREQSFTTFRKAASREAGYEIRLPNPLDFAETRAAIEKKGAVVSTWMERNSSLFYALRMEKFAMGTFLALSALIASFSIVTVLVLLLTQKRKDIGLLMSLGLSPKATQKLFTRVGLILAGFGIGGGLMLGVGVSLAIDHYSLPLLPDIYYDTTIPAKVDPAFVVAVAVIASLIALLSAYLPARNATRELPSEALRSQRQTRAAHL